MMKFSLVCCFGVLAIEKDRVMPVPGIVRSTYWPAQNRSPSASSISSSRMS